MPKLADTRQTKIIELPSFPGSQVEVYSKLTVGDQRQMMNIEGDQFTKSLHGILKCIKSWNFTDDDEGKVPTPITLENLEKFWDEDFKLLLETVSGKSFEEIKQIWSMLIDTEKKN